MSGRVGEMQTMRVGEWVSGRVGEASVAKAGNVLSPFRPISLSPPNDVEGRMGNVPETAGYLPLSPSPSRPLPGEWSVEGGWK